MKSQLTLLLASVVASSMMLASCDDKDGLPVIPFYTIEVESGQVYPVYPDWVFATDERGEPLDAKQMTAGTSVSLYGPIEPGKSFTLHFLDALEIDGRKYFVVRSYAEVPFNGTSHLLTNALLLGDGPNNGAASVEIENLPTGDEHVSYTRVSSIHGALPTQFEGTPLISFPVYETSDFVVNTLIDKAFHYALLKDVAPFDTRTVSLLPVEKPLVINLDENPFTVSVQLTGYRAGDNTRLIGYVNSEYDGGAAIAPTMGYIDGYDQYRTTISYSAGLIDKTYVKLGVPIEEVPKFESPEFVVDSEYLNAFAGSVSVPYHLASLRFNRESFNSSVAWDLSLRGNGSPKPLAFSMKSIPPAIRAAYPDFSIQNLRLISAKVTQFRDNFTYEGTLKDVYSGLSRYEYTPLLSNEYFSYEKIFDF